MGVEIMRSMLPLPFFFLSFFGAKKAYEDYKKAFQAGDDGRPDWMARKSCNYMTAAVEGCGDKLVGECNTCEEVTAMKDEQLKKVLKNVKSSVKDWDTNKCPATKAHMERMKALEEGETVEANCKSSVEDAPGSATQTALTVSIVYSLLLPLLV